MSRHNDSLHLDGPGAAYVRVSDDAQDTERQRIAIRAFLKNQHVTVPKDFWFEDEGWARDTAAHRPRFQDLLKEAEGGFIKWILVSERDRFGTADFDEFMHYRYLLRRWGCKLYDCDGEDWTRKALDTAIRVVFEGEKSEQEQHSISKRALGGKVVRARAGEWTGGLVKLGFDVGCFDRASGKELWRVVWEGRDIVGHVLRKGKRQPKYFIRRLRVYPDGTRERFDGNVVFRTAKDTQWLHLVPSKDKAKLAAVRELFRRYATETISDKRLARWLDSLQIGNAFGKRFQGRDVPLMLTDEAYLGFPTFNKRQGGKFHQVDGDGGMALREPGLRGKVTKSRPADIIRSSTQLYPALVDRKTWLAVQKKLASRESKTHAPRNPELYLVGIVVCAKCGANMVSYAGKGELYCGTWDKCRRESRLADSPCQRNKVRHTVIEEYLDKYLTEAKTRLDLLTAQGGETVLLGRLEGQEESAWRGFRDGFSRLMAYLSRYHPVEHDRLVEDADAQRREEQAWMAAAQEDVPPPPGGLAAYLEAKGITDSDLEALAAAPFDAGSIHTAPDLIVAAVDLYRRLFDPARMQEDIDRLQAEYDAMVDGWRDLPTPAAKARAGEKLAAVEVDLADLKQQQESAAQVVEQQWRAIHDLQQAVATARNELKGKDGVQAARRKAQAVRGVLCRIACEFVPTGAKGKGGPGRAKSRLVALDFQPIAGLARRLEVEDNTGSANGGSRAQDVP
jgi:DNA invertase Pin-like site-specific DNA recombinase